MSTDPESPQEVSNPEASKQPDQGDKSIDKKADGAVNPPAQEKQSSDTPSELVVLGPRFNKKRHGFYVDKLEQAILLPKVRNIALTGGYGTGKSSVLQGLIERIRSSKVLKKTHPIIISLPTIQIADESDSDGNRTDRIQREIVKQLLYRSTPRKMRGSQYRKITHVTAAQRVTVCFIIAVFLTFTFWSLAKPDWHWHWSQGGSLWGYWQPAVIQAISWGMTFYIDWVWINKPTLKGLQLGPTKFELGKNDFSYFDKYLNEIIYYFKVSGTNLVIFEDLDRFNDPYIFDALHELNELINISLGRERLTEQKIPPVKFLYATRDSIFEHVTKGIIKDSNTMYSHQLEIENRTKFFDVIIPIIPFSTSHSAHEYLRQLLNDHTVLTETKRGRKLLKIVGSGISDYRLLVNIASEFQIFIDKIFNSQPISKKPLIEKYIQDLFAFIVYKNTHLTDYEKMQMGHSNIDIIYNRFFALIEDIQEMTGEIFNELGETLNNHIYQKIGPHHEYILSINNAKFSDYTAPELWERALQRDPDGNFPTISIIDSNNKVIDKITDATFAGIVLERLNNDMSFRNKDFQIQNCQRLITYIRSANEINSIPSLLAFKSIPSIREIKNAIDNFKELFKTLFGYDRVTQELLLSNYISCDYHIYTSTFKNADIRVIQALANKEIHSKEN